MSSEYHAELAEYQRQYRLIDPDDPAQFEEWVESTKHLGDIAQSQISGICYEIFRRRKKRRVWEYIPKADAIIVPENWRTKEWLEAQVKLFPISKIAKATGCHRRTIDRLIVRLGVDHKFGLPVHPCDNYEWLYEHRVKQGLSLRRCAALAGLDRDTISRWLAKHKVPLGSSNVWQARTDAHGVNNLWIKNLIKELNDHPLVHHCYQGPDGGICVEYWSELVEVYWPNRIGSTDIGFTRRPDYDCPITRHDAKLVRVPVLDVYEPDLGGQNQYPQLYIPKRTWNRATVINQRMAVHEFLKRTWDRGWAWPRHPESVLQKELDSLRRTVQRRTFGTLGEASLYYGGYKIIQHFFDLQQFAPRLGKRRDMFRFVNRLIEQNEIVSTENLVNWLMRRSKTWPRVPLKLAVILKKLNVRSVLDLHPGWGSNALACALGGCIHYYVAEAGHPFRLAAQRGFPEFLGLNCHDYDGSSPVDLVLCINNYKRGALYKIWTDGKNAKRAIGFIPRGDLGRASRKYPRPTGKIRLRAIKSLGLELGQFWMW